MADHLEGSYFLDSRAMPGAHPDISHLRFIRDGTFLKEDRRSIRPRRRDHDRPGFAYQIAFERNLGHFPRQ